MRSAQPSTSDQGALCKERQRDGVLSRASTQRRRRSSSSSRGKSARPFGGLQMTIHLSLLLLLMIAFIETKPVYGFASNLIVSAMGCMTELDTSEVIMNNLVKSAEDSDFPNMHLEVVLEDDNGTGKNNDGSPVFYSPAPGTTTAELTIRFVNPYTKDEFPEQKELQFVIQLQEDTDGERAPAGTLAEFVSGGTIGCDGNQRVSARLGDQEGSVQLQIHDISASFKLWAGWATGQNAVRLTPPLLLQPDASAVVEGEEAVLVDTKMENLSEGQQKVKDPQLETAKEAVENEAKSKATEKEHVEEDRMQGHEKEKRRLVKKDDDSSKEHRKRARSDLDENEIPKNKKRKFLEDANKMKEGRKRKREASNRGDFKKRRGNGDAGDPERILEEDEDETELDSRSKEGLKLHPDRRRRTTQKKRRFPEDSEEAPPKYDETKRRKDLAAEMERNFPDSRSFRVRYEKGKEISATSHLAGSIFFLVAMAAVFFVFSNRRGDKGRRDL